MNPRNDLGRWAAWLASAGLIAGCAQTPSGSSAPPSPRTAPAAPAAGTAPSSAPAAPEPPANLAPLPAGQVGKTVSNAIELLEAGNEEQASIELQRVLQTEPGHKLAQNLLRQIKDDPVAMLGRESFSYRVQPGESLSKIAGRFLNDVHQFYVLARYNEIKVPRQLAGGQMIRVPGKAPPPAPAPAPVPVPAPSTTPVVTAPPKPAPAPPAASEPTNEAALQAQRQKEAINRHTRAARAAFAKQDLNGAIRAWDSVLELDPNNRTAQLERQKAIDLKEKLTKVK
jgi:tetratricopeptide (TPR) repeat protein